ncbi:hypothetical protein G5X02_002920 [Salmonella enterica]|nr:hypothetical protein [Salmonella enterica]EEO7818504.1 hypothetical protein [Salmonella enterica]EEO8056345.1 hypothetical protein [Salmonella enterica]EEP0045052.1 hypothetical protein [Salmonella enterica]
MKINIINGSEVSRLSVAIQVQFGVTLDYPWAASDEMERLTADMKPASRVSDALPSFLREGRRMKLGRNEPCHCGSGIKYKKCCLK